MAVPVTLIHVFEYLGQSTTNIKGLQRDIANNAAAWKTIAQAQSVPQPTLRQFMLDAAASYSKRIGWLDTAQADTAFWAQVTTLWTILGGTGADFNSVVNPMRTVATSIPTADLSTYAAIITACNSIIAAIPPPPSLWPE